MNRLIRRAACWAWLVLAALAHPAMAADTAPYPASTYLSELTLDWSTFRRLGQSSDNWPMTWAGNGGLYSSWGDGGGLGAGAGSNAYVSLGVARLTGSSALSLQGENLIGGVSPEVAPCFPVPPGAPADTRKSTPGQNRPCYLKGLYGKSRSMLALDDALYMFITPKHGEYGMDEARLYRAPLDSNDWTRADWAFTKEDPYPLVTPVFTQAGQNGADGDGYVYAYAARYAPVASATRGKQWIQRGLDGGEIVLLRALRTADLMSQASWEFFTGLDQTQQPQWSAAIASALTVFRDPAGVGFGNTSVYLKSLGRYLLIAPHGAAYTGQFGVFEAPEPWGPWRTVFYGAVGSTARNVPANGFFANFLPSAFSADGTRFSLVFTGKQENDALNVLDGRLTVNLAARQR